MMKKLLVMIGILALVLNLGRNLNDIDEGRKPQNTSEAWLQIPIIRFEDIFALIQEKSTGTSTGSKKDSEETSEQETLSESDSEETSEQETLSESDSEETSEQEIVSENDSQESVEQKTPPDLDFAEILSELSLPSDTPIANLYYDGDCAIADLDSEMINCPEEIVLVHPDESLWNGQYADLTGRWFWADMDGYSRNNINGVQVMTLYFQYTETDPDRIYSMKQDIDVVTEDILEEIPDDADTWTKAKIIHDALVKKLTYDHTKSMPHIRDIYCLVTGDAVCAGYADAFSYLMEQAGEFATVVSNEEHAWNKVIGYQGNDTYVDVTWDDPDFVCDDGTTSINYDYFGLSYDDITKIPSHNLTAGEQVTYENTEPFNYFERTGSRIDCFSYEKIADIFAEQYDAGEKNLSVQFSDAEGYEEAVEELIGDNCSLLRQMLNDIGYTDLFYYHYNDTNMTICVTL